MNEHQTSEATEYGHLKRILGIVGERQQGKFACSAEHEKFM